MTHLPDARRDDEFIKIFRRSPFDHIFAGLLQSRGANVNKKDSKGYSPLLFAARIGEVSALTWLKTFKADMNARDNLGSSALHVAAINGRLDAVRWLLRSTAGGGAGLDPNARNTIGVNHGADPNAITVGGWRPIDFANNRINSGWKGEYSDIIGWLKLQNAGEDSKQAHTEEKRRLQPRDWNPGTPRQLVACPGGNDKNRQKVSADIFSANNTFVKQKHNNQEDED